MKWGRQAQIAKAAGISVGFLSQLLSGKIYRGSNKPRGASWKTYEALGRATDTPPELWARSIAHGKPQKIVAAIEAADQRRQAQTFSKTAT